MSVVVDIKINDHLIAMYAISRIETGEIDNRYRVSRHYPDSRPNQDDALVTLRHHYDDPVESLVSRAIALAQSEWGPVPRIRS